METTTLTPGLVDAYKKIMTDPKTHGFDFRPLDQCFKESEKATAKHELFNQYIAYINKPLPKLMFYIIMDELHSDKIGKDANGLLGYNLEFINLNPELTP